MSKFTTEFAKRPSPQQIIVSALTKAIEDSLPELTTEQREFFHKLFPEIPVTGNNPNSEAAEKTKAVTPHYTVEHRLTMALDLINRTLTKNEISKD